MNRRTMFIFAVTLALIGASAGMLAWFKAGQRLGPPGLKTSPLPGSRNLQVNLPGQVLDLKSEPVAEAEAVTNYLPRDTSYGQRIYTAPDGWQMVMNVVLMGSDRASIHKPEICLTAQGWTIDKSELLAIPVAQPHPYGLPVMKLTAGRQAQINGQSLAWRGIYVYWFVADDRITAKHWQRMWWLAERLMRTGMLERWAYVSCFSACPPGQEEATYQRMQQTISAAVPQFQLVAGPAAGAGKSN